MKRALCLILTASLLFSFSGCLSSKNPAESEARFYYLRSELVYGESDGVIASEVREAYGRTGDLRYMLLLYLRGPASSGLYTPFPGSTQLVSVEQQDTTLYVTLGGISFAQQSELERTLACACLAKTCFELADISCIHINTETDFLANEQDIIFDEDSLVLLDTAYTVPAQTESD